MTKQDDLSKRASAASIDAALAGDLDTALTLTAISQAAKDREGNQASGKPDQESE